MHWLFVREPARGSVVSFMGALADSRIWLLAILKENVTCRGKGPVLSKLPALRDFGLDKQ